MNKILKEIEVYKHQPGNYELIAHSRNAKEVILKATEDEKKKFLKEIIKESTINNFY